MLLCGHYAIEAGQNKVSQVFLYAVLMMDQG